MKGSTTPLDWAVNFFCLWIAENVPGQKALEIKHHQKYLEYLWNKTKNESNQECDYFSSLIVSLGEGSHLEILFKVTQSLLVGIGLRNICRTTTKIPEADKVTKIHSELDSSCADALKLLEAQLSIVI